MTHKIYLAGSWKNIEHLLLLQATLRDLGFEVDCFASTDTGRTSFNWACLNNALGCPNQAESEFKLKEMNARDLLKYPEVQKAFLEDKKWIDWCDTLILTLPSGKSAHLEAGYAKGQGKKLFIFGVLEKGERDVMYGFADGIFEDDYDFSYLIEALKGCDPHSEQQAWQSASIQDNEWFNERETRKDEREKVLGRLDKEIAIRENEMNRKAGLEDNLTTMSGYYAAAGALNWIRVVLIKSLLEPVIR